MKMQYGWAFPESDDFMANELKSDGTYQATHLRAALAFVTDWSTGIDCGAHVGSWTRLMCERFSRVISVEPSADTFEALKVNMAAFGCTNAELKNVAMGEKAGRISMVLDGKGLAMKNTGARHIGKGSDVSVETIDSWNLPSVGFIKLDVEGSELYALRGAKDTLRRCKPIVLYEDKNLWWKHYGEPKTAVAAFMRGHGYREVARASMDAIYAPK